MIFWGEVYYMWVPGGESSLVFLATLSGSNGYIYLVLLGQTLKLLRCSIRCCLVSTYHLVKLIAAVSFPETLLRVCTSFMVLITLPWNLTLYPGFIHSLGRKLFNALWHTGAPAQRLSVRSTPTVIVHCCIHVNKHCVCLYSVSWKQVHCTAHTVGLMTRHKGKGKSGQLDSIQCKPQVWYLYTMLGLTRRMYCVFVVCGIHVGLG